MPSKTGKYISPPIYRTLRGFAIDPSLAQDFNTAPVSQILFKLPWEEVMPGPVGEYLEVIDYDPAGKCFYEPVNLNDPFVLAQDGLTPSEGTPQFHQQMVYAVAQLTIINFEKALGRRTLWAPGPSLDPKQPKQDSHYVPRLRIYPHALREPNAYYSPAKKALLFGYFPAGTDEGDEASSHIPGSMVFTCLSHDIVAHETTHALLDGLHRRLNRATNPDMLAFHEAFADIVALFQHFTFPEIMRHEIARTRGDLIAQESLLVQLAQEFGRATGSRGALRDAIGKYSETTGKWERQEPNPADYLNTFEPHQRGSILVGAVFDAFVTIYNNRIADLLRLYTSGSGVMPAGSVHPDLVTRLGEEASKAANHVLAMCVRALDYCPPVDLTFGEYLRALITADADLVKDDERNYRVAFAEAFRHRGIYPRDVRTLSVENLIWRTGDGDTDKPSDELVKILGDLRDFGHHQLYAPSRQELFSFARETRRKLHDQLAAHFANQETLKQDSSFLGLDLADHDFEIHQIHFASRVGPNGGFLLQAIVQITQEKEIEVVEGKPDQGTMYFQGGCTVIVDLAKKQIAYCIRKSFTSTARPNRQRDYIQGVARATLQATYLDARDYHERREPFALIHRGG